MSTNDRITHLEAQTQDLHTRLQAREDEIARLTAARAQAHAEVAELQRKTETIRGEGRKPTVIDPKSMAPSEIGKPGGPSWRRWSVVARNYLSCVLRMPELKEALLNVEKEKNPLGDDEYDLLGIDPQIGSEIHTFLIAKSDGDAAEIVEGTTGCHGAEV